MKKGVILFLIGIFLSIVSATSLTVSFFSAVAAFSIALVFKSFCVIDSIRISLRHKTEYAIKPYNKWYLYLLVILICYVIIEPLTGALLKEFAVKAYKIPAGSMEPTLQIGDRIIARSWSHPPATLQRGDIVIFPYPENPEKDFIKRIVGLGGESIEIKDKTVFINGKQLNEPFAMHKDSRAFQAAFSARDNMGPITIPEDSMFVMGDNRDNSHDSRFFGFVKTDSVTGKAKCIYWSWDSKAASVRWDRIGAELP